MTIIVHYNTNEGPKNYSISGSSKAELEKALKSFEDMTKLNSSQYTIELVSTSI